MTMMKKIMRGSGPFVCACVAACPFCESSSENQKQGKMAQRTAKYVFIVHLQNFFGLGRNRWVLSATSFVSITRPMRPVPLDDSESPSS